MVARVRAPALLTRPVGLGVGAAAAVAPALLALGVFIWTYPWFAATLAMSCLGAGAVIGATLGQRLAARPDPLGVLMVAAIAVVVGDLIAAVIYPLGSTGIDSVDVIFGGLLLGIPAYFFLAFPGLVAFILLARRVAPAAAP